MNHNEKTQYHNDSEEYLRVNNVREIFQKAALELVCKQPDDPLNFLISFLSQRKKFRVFSVIGFPEETRREVVDEVASQFNLKIVQLDPVNKGLDTLLNDSNDYSIIISSLSSYQTNYDGVLLDNFPITRNQLDSFRKKKVYIDHIFSLVPSEMRKQEFDEEMTLRLSNVDIISSEMPHLTTIFQNNDPKKITQRISDFAFIKLNQKISTPAPHFIYYYHPAKPELKCWLQTAAKYYDLHVIDIDDILENQREKLKKLGVISHEILTRRLPIPDEVL